MRNMTRCAVLNYDLGAPKFSKRLRISPFQDHGFDFIELVISIHLAKRFLTRKLWLVFQSHHHNFINRRKLFHLGLDRVDQSIVLSFFLPLIQAFAERIALQPGNRACDQCKSTEGNEDNTQEPFHGVLSHDDGIESTGQ